MPMKRHKGRVHVVSAPQRAAEGRRALVAPATKARARFGRDGTNESRVLRLALALVEVAIAIEAERAEPSPSAQDARRRAERRARDLRGLLVKAGGREAVGELQRALSADGGALLRACGRAHVDVRPALVRAAITFANVAREHEVRASSALALLGRSARWSAVSEALLEQITDGGVRAEGIGELVKLAQTAGAQARLDLLGALQLSKHVADTTPDPAVEARVAEGKR